MNNIESKICEFHEMSSESNYYQFQEPSTTKFGKGGMYYHRFRYECGRFVNNYKTQKIFLIFIAINSIMMGVSTYKFVREDPAVHKFFEIADNYFLIAFTFELALQVMHHGIKLFNDGWLVFDAFIISISWFCQGVKIFRAFRILRMKK